MPSFGMWRTDASLIQPGAIVNVRRPADSRGRPTHDHWFVVITPQSEIQLGAILTAIAISSSLRKGEVDPAKHHPLPYRESSTGHPETGLRKPSWACVDWVLGLEVIEGDEADLEIKAEFDYHFIAEQDLKALISLRNAWAGRQRENRRR